MFVTSAHKVRGGAGAAKRDRSVCCPSLGEASIGVMSSEMRVNSLNSLTTQCDELKTPIGLVPTQVRNNSGFSVAGNVLSSAFILNRQIL